MKTETGIPSTMRALKVYGPHDLKLENAPVPKINEEEILIRVKATGICAGDIKIVDGAQMFWGGGVLPKWVDEPVTLGHEFSGEVVAIGDEMAERTQLSLGDAAIAEQIIPCNKGEYCKSGRHWMCKEQTIYGSKKNIAEGSMAEYKKFYSNSIVYKLPEGIQESCLAMIEPLSCAVHTIERANIQFGDIAVIGGLGPIGLCKLQLARLKNPQLLIGIDLHDKRLKLAREYGADYVFNPQECDVVDEVKKLSDGYGCDVYIHCSGHPEGVKQGLKMLRSQGTYVEFSVFMNDTAVDWSIIGDRKELDIRGAHISGLNGYKVAIDMLSKGHIDVSEIVTHEFDLEEYEEAFNISKAGTDSIKVILKS